jgi:hypothetical protein
VAVGPTDASHRELTRRRFLVGGTLALGAPVAACAGSDSPSPGASSIDEFATVLKGSGADEGIDPPNEPPVHRRGTTDGHV